MRSRIAGSRFGAGAISTTFWCRRCTEQSRSNRWMTLPAPSARICTSMCRGSTTACSMNTVGSPKAPSASRMQVSIGLAQVLPVVDPAHARGRRHRRRPSRTAGTACSRADSTSASTSVDGSTDASVGHAGRLGGGDRPGLVAGQREHLGGGADEGDAGVRARLGELRVLREEAVAGVDRVGAGLAPRPRRSPRGRGRPAPGARARRSRRPRRPSAGARSPGPRAGRRRPSARRARRRPGTPGWRSRPGWRPAPWRTCPAG